jgi:hypothetical protein
MSIAQYFVPDDAGPPMTDQDLVYLDRLPRLQRVNLGGTRVGARAIAAFRTSHPTVIVEDREEE